MRAAAAGLLGLVVLAGGVAGPRPAGADQIAVDLGQHLISIHSGFTGAEVLLFGARDGDGDVVVVLRGPEERVVVRRKERIAGIWVNRSQLTFTRVPGYYAIATTRPLDQIGTPEMFEVNEIGLENVSFEPAEPVAEHTWRQFREALARGKQRLGLYASEPLAITFIGPQLFRANFDFPAEVPTGLYRADIFLIDDGILISRRTTALEVSKVGIEATVYGIAHRQPFLYGLLAVTLALLAGWLAAVMFRRA